MLAAAAALLALCRDSTYEKQACQRVVEPLLLLLLSSNGSEAAYVCLRHLRAVYHLTADVDIDVTAMYFRCVARRIFFFFLLFYFFFFFQCQRRRLCHCGKGALSGRPDDARQFGRRVAPV